VGAVFSNIVPLLVYVRKNYIFHWNNSYTMSHEPFPFKSFIISQKNQSNTYSTRIQLSNKPITLKGHILLRQPTEWKSNGGTVCVRLPSPLHRNNLKVFLI
jgi:hypothetical protein